MPRQVLLFTRAGCHLCEEAAALLERHGLSPQKIDIHTTPELCAKYDACVPVVVFDGIVRFRGQVNEILLKRLLKS